VPAEGSAGDALVVDLDPETFKRVEQLDARTSEGPPSLRGCRRLRVHGDVSFGRDVALEGEVEIVAPAGEALRIPDGARLTG